MAEAMEGGKRDMLILTGMGGSYCAFYPACIYLNEHGLLATVLEASELLHYHKGLISERVLLVMASQSGETIEVRSILEEVACQLAKEVGTELGISARAIIRRLSLEDEDVEVVLAGSIFKAEGALLIDTIKQVIHEVAPQASIALPKFEPVVGALFLALEAAGVEVKGKVKDDVKATLPKQLVIER